MSCEPCPIDVSDRDWNFAARYVVLIAKDAAQREHSLREVLNALRWLARAGLTWRPLTDDSQPWEAVYQQSRRWLDAGRFKSMTMNLYAMICFSFGRQGQPSAVDLNGRTLESTARSACAVVTTSTNASVAARCT
jgi:transposase